MQGCGAREGADPSRPGPYPPQADGLDPLHGAHVEHVHAVLAVHRDVGGAATWRGGGRRVSEPRPPAPRPRRPLPSGRAALSSGAQPAGRQELHAPALEGPFAPKVPEHRARLCPRSAFHTGRRGEQPCGEQAAPSLPPATTAETGALGSTCLELRWGRALFGGKFL